MRFIGPGPATIVRQVGECILSTVGPVVYMYRLSSASLELDQIAFFYAQFFIASVSIVRNYIYLADALSSVQLLVWRELDSSLTLAASDFEPFACVASACLQDGNKLSLVVADDDANAKVLHYNPRLNVRQAFLLSSTNSPNDFIVTENKVA